MTKAKPKLPTGFPLFFHAGSGQWAKKVRGKRWYFGTDKQAALLKWIAERDDLLAGLGRRVRGDGVILVDGINRFLTSKSNRVDSGELTLVSFKDYHRTCACLLEVFGRNVVLAELRSEDFEKLRAWMVKKGWGPVKLKNEISRCRVAFNYMSDVYDIKIKYGREFVAPTKRVLKAAMDARGPLMFEADEIHRMLKAASVPMKAMILLGCNAGLGNADIGMIEHRHIKGEWLTFPRVKNGANRRAWLWPGTLLAIDTAIAKRPKVKSADLTNRVFLTKTGQSWHQPETGAHPLSAEFKKLLLTLGLHRPRTGFYTLRRVCETIGGDARDPIAVDYVMGHTTPGMGTTYRQGVDDGRVKLVCQHIRSWLFNGRKPKAK